MQSNNLNALYNLLRTEPEQHEEQSAQLTEVASLVQYSQALELGEAKRQRSSRGIFIAGGISLAALAVVLLLRAVVGFDSIALQSLGGVLLLAGGGYTLAQLQSNALGKLQLRASELQKRIVKPGGPKLMLKTKKLYRSRRDRVIGGVAAGLARQSGLPAGVVRLLFLAMIPFSYGISILVYLILLLGMSPAPPDTDA